MLKDDLGRYCGIVLAVALIAAPAIAEDSGMTTILSASGKLDIVRKPGPADYAPMQDERRLKDLPKYDPDSREVLQIDLRSTDLTSLRLSGSLAELRFADFDSKTKWPKDIPSAFDPKAEMELGKDPGLGMRVLHAKGYTGKGVGIAIIDQAILVSHVEYRDRLKLYEEVHWLAGSDAQMHGPAVSSIAAGKSVGVAPGADLYFIACWMGDSSADGGFTYNLDYLAKAIDRVIAVDSMLPRDRRIRVISISLGLGPDMANYDAAMAAIQRARLKGIETIYVGSERFMGLGRDPVDDPNLASSYGKGLFWRNFAGDAGSLLVPMDSRCVAAPNGDEDYAFYRSGGMSWAVPYFAGMYAIACQVNPEMTYDSFWGTLHVTADACDQGGALIGYIVNPAEFVRAIGARQP